MAKLKQNKTKTGNLGRKPSLHGKTVLFWI